MTDHVSGIPLTLNIADGFGPVGDVFKANFEDDLELGAGFYAIKDGQVLIDMFGGYTDRKKQTPWQANTIVPVYSTTKAISALVIAHLAELDRLGYDQCVATLWPEFAAHGKGELTIGQVLSHQAGLSGITNPNWTPADWFDWGKTCAELAGQKPIWEPTTASGYHPVTYGYLAGEIARRADKQGRTLGQILAEDICTPEGIDFRIGTPVSEHHRCAAMLKPTTLSSFGDINEPTRMAFLQKWSSPGGRGAADWRVSEFPAANGHGTAKALATLMQAFNNGRINDHHYLSEDMIEKVSRPQISGQNLVLPFTLTFAAGVIINKDNLFYGPNPQTLGHSGWGGSCAFADPVENMTVAYIMNKQSSSLLGDKRPLKLIEALYSCL